jgi:hypothetical protein
LKVSDHFKTQYLNYLKTYLPEEIVRGSEFQNAVYEILSEMAELSSPAVCEARKKGLALLCESSDLAERTLRLKAGDEFIAGARFKNLDVNFPFIEILVGFNMSDEVLQEVSENVQMEFKNLNPLGLKFKDKPGAYPNLKTWSHTVFGKIDKQENLNLPPKLSCSFTHDLDWHNQYVSEYQKRLVEKKELNGFVRIGEIDEFQESANCQALMILRDVNGFCGVVSGIENSLYGLPAIYIIESYLSSRWIGKRLATTFHLYFLNEMAKRFDYVWGTIYDQNISSLKTSLRIGRRIIETEYFLQFDK